jgi:hypothetical protein
MDVVPLVFSDACRHSNAGCNAGNNEEPPPTPLSDRSPLLRLPTELLIDITSILDTGYREDRQGVNPLAALRL